MNKKLLLFGVISAVVFSAFVVATHLNWEREVSTCFDSDGGLNSSIQGTVSGVTLSGFNYSRPDSCVNSSAVGEYACSISGNSTFVQLWSLSCEGINVTCVNGACI